MELSEIKKFLENLNQDDVSFDPHFYKRSRERPITEGMVRSFLSQANKLQKVEQRKEKDRFKLWFRMSGKYSLIVIIEIKLSEDLKVISAWNTSRTWQNQLKR